MAKHEPLPSRLRAVATSEVDTQQSTAPKGLAACVTDQMAQMRLEPVDTKSAHASFTWVFAPGPKKSPPADPFADTQAAVLACYTTHLSEVDREAQGDLVIDYAFNTSGAVDRLDVVKEATTAPPPVVECATSALRAANLDPKLLDERNTAGRRSFTLRYAAQ